MLVKTGTIYMSRGAAAVFKSATATRAKGSEVIAFLPIYRSYGTSILKYLNSIINGK
ncbi:MAG: hypothetical protein LBC68_03170 [Prevotellaceae bacterium]|nr:hypothetical protein [Prevotellaceae bacterium]